ncbi:MAG: PKD domain-containing protein [Bacteroidales bacterium]|nr:PKD domain-containing protein [Bacteroidales bacterium]
MHRSLLLLVAGMFLHLGSFAQTNTESLDTAMDTANYPYWIDMMQDPSVNFFKVQRAFDQYWENRPVTRSSGWKVFKRWEYMMESRVSPNGTRPAPDEVFKAYKAFTDNTESTSGNWISYGPSLIPSPGPPGYIGLGRLNVIGFHPTDTNTLFVGSPSGGFWKTTDGGLNWVTTTDAMPTLGVSAIVADYSNPSKILIGTGDRDAGDAPGMGVYKSLDGGLTWAASNSGMGNKTVGKIIQHPTTATIFLAATNSGVYRSTDGGASWTISVSGNFKDICFKPNDPTIVYAAKNADFFRSSNNGVSFTQITSGLTTGQRGTIAVTAANPNYVYFVHSNTSSGFKGLYRSTDAGLNFSTRSTSPNILDWSCNGSGTGGQGWYDLALTADPLNAETIYVGGVNVWKSTNGGTSWAINSHWYGGCSVAEVHADCHFLTYSPLNGTLWACNDGGVYFTTNGGTTWTDRTETMTIGQIYKLGQSQTVKEKVINGFQDNGSYTYNASGWEQSGGGDGMECAVDFTNAAYTYYTIYYGDIYRLFNNGNDLHIAGNGTFGITESGAWITPFILSESDAKMMFVGFKNVWRCNDVRTTNNLTWTKISNNLAGSNSSNMAVLEQSPVNTDILYAARSGNKLFRTDNCMAATPTWVDLTSSLPATGTATDLAAHPTEANTVYMTMGNNVYKSTDKGLSWTTITGNLPGIHMNTIVCYANGPEALYVGTDAGVYYKDLNTVTWINFNSGLPVSAEITELEVYYDNDSVSADVIRASTYGRGLWGSDMYVPYSVDFSADSTTICQNLNVDFTDLSSGTPISWSWSFPGGTPATSTQQNPADIVYNSPGTYDVTLTTTWNNYTTSATKPDYITVDPLPDTPGTPDGDTLLCENNPSTIYTIDAVANATSYTWMLEPDTAGILTPSDTSVLIDWVDTWTGYATLTVQAGGDCGTTPASPALQIHLRPFPEQPAAPSGATPLCQGSSNTLYTTSPAANALSYEWALSPVEAGSISGSDTVGTVVWSNLFAGTASVQVKSINACNESEWSGPFDVTIFPYPDVNLGEDTSITYTQSLILDAGNPGADYLWSTGDTTQTIDASYTGNPFITYWVEATLDGCSGSDTISVTYTDPVFISDPNHGIRIQIIPNPNNGDFVLDIASENPGNFILEVSDMKGRIAVRKQLVNPGKSVQEEISIPGAQDGVYLLRIISETSLLVEKILVLN